MEQTESSEDLIAQGERWDPLGAAEPEEDASNLDFDDQDYWQSFASYDSEKLRILEEEQEQLNTSLMALTSHFAQVQFRLKQIVDAEPETKETLLKELEEFAFRGIPDFQKTMWTVDEEQNSEQDHATKMESHKVKQQELITQLKQQLEDLERYAYETGEAGLPQTLIVERQKIIIDQMKSKLQFNVDDLDKYTVEELKQQVDQAIGQLVNPLKMKEQLVAQLKTQVTDLERFIEFLQGPAEKKCQCIASPKPSSKLGHSHANRSGVSTSKPLRLSEKNEKINQTLRRITNLMQVFIMSQFGCGVNANFSREMPTKGKNSELREGLNRLNEAVLNVLKTTSVTTRRGQVANSLEPDNQVNIVKAVRKGLCSALRELLIHGLIQPNTSSSLVPFFSCATPRTGPSSSATTVHPWQLFVAFYRTKDGQSVMSTPQRSLAQSFSLELQGGTTKQSLLVAIGNIIAMHRPYKRGPEAHFKAFLSSALNAKKIVPWLRIILRNSALLDEFYEPWALVVQPDFDEAWKILEPLQRVDFQLPEDLSIRSLRNMFDAF